MPRSRSWTVNISGTPAGELVKVLQRVTKPAKVAIGSWGDAEPGVVATTRRFNKQLGRVLNARTEYGVEQGVDNLGVAIATARSGIVVVDGDTGKVPYRANNPEDVGPTCRA